MKLSLQHLQGNVLVTTKYLRSNHILILLHFLAGFVQFIESTPVAEVLDKDEDRSIQV